MLSVKRVRAALMEPPKSPSVSQSVSPSISPRKSKHGPSRSPSSPHRCNKKPRLELATLQDVKYAQVQAARVTSVMSSMRAIVSLDVSLDLTIGANFKLSCSTLLSGIDWLRYMPDGSQLTVLEACLELFAQSPSLCNMKYGADKTTSLLYHIVQYAMRLNPTHPPACWTQILMKFAPVLQRASIPPHEKLVFMQICIDRGADINYHKSPEGKGKCASILAFIQHDPVLLTYALRCGADISVADAKVVWNMVENDHLPVLTTWMEEGYLSNTELFMDSPARSPVQHEICTLLREAQLIRVQWTKQCLSSELIPDLADLVASYM